MSGFIESRFIPLTEIPSVQETLSRSFEEGKTKSITWRRGQLKQLWRMLDTNESSLHEAMFLDTGKLKLEGQLFELSLVKNEILHFLQELDNWLESEAVSVPPPFQHWQPTIYKQPKGLCLIIAPWNYPICLTMLPLVAMIASGNTCIIKPSELSPNVAQALTDLLPSYLDDSCFRFLNGAVEVVTALLDYPYGHIVYTGNGTIGKVVMTAAAKYLTPVTLELGGKSPVIVSNKANIQLAAKRIAWGKFFNAGQTCMCPDYALVHEKIFPEFLDQLKMIITKFYGVNAAPKTARIINRKHWDRLTSLLNSTKGTQLVVGGTSSAEGLFIPPTVLTDLTREDAVFESEIFGPILPILTFSTLAQVPSIVSDIDRTPLGLYIFTEDMDEASMIRRETASGGMAINDVMGQVAVTSLAFGGFGTSGMGCYRGKAGIDTLSHRKSVATVPTTADFEALLEWRYVDGDQEEKFKAFKMNLDGKLKETEA